MEMNAMVKREDLNTQYGISVCRDVEKAIKEISTEDFVTEIFGAFGASEEQIYNTVYGSNLKVSDFLDTDIEVAGIIISSAKTHEKMDDDTSPEIIKPCVTFITKDGETLSSISNGIWRGAKGLIQMGVGETKNCIVRFIEVQTKKGKAHTVKVIRFIEKGDISIEE